tara:strand:- start:264 stop:983 length:720 start_codon:yes stop_codon:yes gene_type:complete
MNNKKISIGLPTYNEEKIIYKTLENLLPILNKEFFDFEVIVIDNNSNDKTIEKVEEFLENNKETYKKNFHIIKNEKNILYSGSVEKIINFSIFEYVVIMDADGQYNPRDIIKCYNFITQNNLDLVFGNRVKRNDNSFRKFISLIFKHLNMRILNSKLQDINCGLKILKKYKEVSFSKELNHVNPEIYALYKSDGKIIREIFVDHNERQFGESINNFSNILKDFIKVLIYLIKIKNKYKI